MIARLFDRIRSAPGAVRWVLALLGVAAAMNLLVLALNHYSNVLSGPVASSSSTVPDGVAAYYDLLQGEGHQVSQITSGGALTALSGSGALVVLEAGYLPQDQIDPLEHFVRSGGLLIVGVSQPEPWLSRLSPGGPTWSPDPLGTVSVTTQVPQTAGVGVVTTAGAGSWTETGQAVTIAGSQRGSLVATSSLGHGSIEYVSDPTFLFNALLSRTDNAALGLDLVRPGDSVAFLETIHGFGEASGYGAIPLQWKLGLSILAAAALLFLIARGRRLGAPEEQEDEAPPPRSTYVTSMAYTLVRAKDPPGALRPLADELRSVVARRARLSEGASVTEFDAAGRGLGLNENERRILREGVTDLNDGLTAGRALARLGKGEA